MRALEWEVDGGEDRYRLHVSGELAGGIAKNRATGVWTGWVVVSQDGENRVRVPAARPARSESPP